MDATREQVLDWCIDNKIDFSKPIFPPPEGWMWGEADVPAMLLTTVFTFSEDEDIESIDVLLAVCAKAHIAELEN